MPSIHDLFPSKYLSGGELRGAVTVIIDRVGTEQIYRPGEGRVNAFVIYCQKASKGVILNKVLALQIAEAVGEEDTDKWRGYQVVLYPQPQPAGSNGNGAAH